MSENDRLYSQRESAFERVLHNVGTVSYFLQLFPLEVVQTGDSVTLI